MEIKNELPKKSPLSMQMDLSRFELATADENANRTACGKAPPFLRMVSAS